MDFQFGNIFSSRPLACCERLRGSTVGVTSNSEQNDSLACIRHQKTMDNKPDENMLQYKNNDSKHIPLVINFHCRPLLLIFEASSSNSGPDSFAHDASPRRHRRVENYQNTPNYRRSWFSAMCKWVLEKYECGVSKYPNIPHTSSSVNMHRCSQPSCPGLGPNILGPMTFDFTFTEEWTFIVCTTIHSQRSSIQS